MKLLLLWLFTLPVMADTVYLSPIHQAAWQVNSSPLVCSLEHEITDFGKVAFKREGGDVLQLYISTQAHPASQTSAELMVINTPWQNEIIHLKLATIPIKYGQREFYVDGQTAMKALSALQQGQSVQLYYAAQSSIGFVSAIFSNVQFLPAMREFQDCTEQMHPDSFVDLNQINVFFESEKALLDNHATQLMQRLADYLKIDDSISRIIIESHTDSFGRRALNTELSEKRAEVVKSFLIEQGEVAPEIIETHSYRDTKPVANNKTPAGRSQNRRTEIRLIR